jgi:acyl-lipid omega-6 desaturase (Delta-12 desaturase)
MLEIRPARGPWREIPAGYLKPSALRAAWQLITTLGAYALLWGLIYLGLEVSRWLALPLIILGAGLLVRLFVIFHDCVHGSFFRSRRANDCLGFVIGVLTFTPYYHWRRQHIGHHASSGDLDRRGMGDVWTLTVQEYLESSRWRRLSYRVARNPLILFVIVPLFYFVFAQRFCGPGYRRERHSVRWTNLAILGVAAALSLLFGVKTYLAVQLGMMLLAGMAGTWLFYVQHQFNGTYWARGDQWDYAAAALQGSSYYKLPRILQWFSGNIGFHHVHHLSPGIPNYHLQKCHDAGPAFLRVKSLTLRSSLASISLRLWDEQSKRLVGYPSTTGASRLY